MQESLNMVGKLSVTYSGKPTIQSLLKLVPGWSSVDTLLQRRANEIRSDRLSTFFEELAEGKHELTDELIQTENFLHSYFCTLRAVLNCRHREKIKLLAHLLNSAFDPALQVTSDEHEELLAILEDISLREFALLHDLRKKELAHPRNKEENDLQHLKKYWDEFKTTNIQTLGISADSFNAFMTRLERTGLYVRLTGSYYDYYGDMGTTTPTLDRLILLINPS
jgi:hypothetical protein